MEAVNGERKESKLFKKLCKKFGGKRPSLSWTDFEGCTVLYTKQNETQFLLNNNGTTIFYRRREGEKLLCFECKSPIIRTKIPFFYNCAELNEMQEDTINYPHCPRCKPIEKLPSEIYSFFNESIQI